MPNNTKALIGAVIAALLAAAVYLGYINQQTADNVQHQANQTLGTTPATPLGSPQPAPSATTAQNPAPAPASTSAPSPAATPRQ